MARFQSLQYTLCREEVTVSVMTDSYSYNFVVASPAARDFLTTTCLRSESVWPVQRRTPHCPARGFFFGKRFGIGAHFGPFRRLPKAAEQIRQRSKPLISKMTPSETEALTVSKDPTVHSRYLGSLL